jgi:mannose-1-phosphate guanylyltransferase/phosphomannomutase
VFPALLREGLPFHAWRLDTYWNDVGNIEQYRIGNFDALLGRVELDVPGRQLRPRVWVGQGTEIDPGARLEAPVLIGAGCLIETGAELIGPLIIGDGCVVEHGAVLEGVINWDGVKAGRNAHVAGSILGRNVGVHHEAVVREDTVIGDRSQIGAHATLLPGTRLEPRSHLTQSPPPGAGGVS